MDFGCLLVNEGEGRCPPECGQFRKCLVDRCIAVSVDNAVSVIPRELRSERRLQFGRKGPQFAEAQSRERWIGFHGDEGRPVEPRSGVAIYVLRLTCHQVEIDPFRRTLGRAVEGLQIQGEYLQLVAVNRR